VRRVTLPPAVDLRAVPRALLAAAVATILATAASVAVLGPTRGLGAALLLVGAIFGPREYRIARFVSAAFYLVDPVLHTGQWEAERRSRWRARLKQAGAEIDYTYRPEAVTAARKSKYITLRIVPAWSLWPKPAHVRACTVRIPPRKTIAEVGDRLTVVMAEYFQVPTGQLEVTERHRWLRSTVTFTPRPPERAASGPTRYTEVVRRGQPG
jgi:hypothetical protein